MTSRAGSGETERRGDLQMLLDSLQVCSNLLDAAARLSDLARVHEMCSTANDVLSSVRRLRLAIVLDGEAAEQFDHYASEIQRRLDDCWPKPDA